MFVLVLSVVLSSTHKTSSLTDAAGDTLASLDIYYALLQVRIVLTSDSTLLITRLRDIKLAEERDIDLSEPSKKRSVVSSLTMASSCPDLLKSAL